MAARSQTKTPWLLIFLLLLLGFFVLIFALPSLKTQTSTNTQTTSEGQCLQNGQGFDEQQEAFTLAQAAEQYRATHSFGGNYAYGSYTLCFQDGTQQRFQSPPAPGFDNNNDQTRPVNATHSEQGIYNWLQQKLSRLSSNQTGSSTIYVVIFSQVTVCGLCRKDMELWQRGLRQAAKTANLFLSIWDIIAGKGFNPATYPAGTGTPVLFEDLEKVPITFVP